MPSPEELWKSMRVFGCSSWRPFTLHWERVYRMFSEKVFPLVWMRLSTVVFCPTSTVEKSRNRDHFSVRKLSCGLCIRFIISLRLANEYFIWLKIMMSPRHRWKRYSFEHWSAVMWGCVCPSLFHFIDYSLLYRSLFAQIGDDGFCVWRSFSWRRNVHSCSSNRLLKAATDLYAQEE